MFSYLLGFVPSPKGIIALYKIDIFYILHKRTYAKCSEQKTIEVDFVAQKPGGEVEYYQVALYALASEETLRRELASLEEIDDNYPKFLLTMDPGNGKGHQAPECPRVAG